uniref:Uncharacterized protein n=1 Tax=Timema shepardi TaxID=629360 RepID=A0A7R9FV93_TIMSH|nr:unnamed protein product [Timema shepardi]
MQLGHVGGGEIPTTPVVVYEENHQRNNDPYRSNAALRSHQKGEEWSDISVKRREIRSAICFGGRRLGKHAIWALDPLPPHNPSNPSSMRGLDAPRGVYDNLNSTPRHVDRTNRPQCPRGISSSPQPRPKNPFQVVGNRMRTRQSLYAIFKDSGKTLFLIILPALCVKLRRCDARLRYISDHAERSAPNSPELCHSARRGHLSLGVGPPARSVRAARQRRSARVMGEFPGGQRQADTQTNRAH